MTREEAIEVIKRTKGAMVYTEKEKEALEILIPEFTESEDEKIIRAIIDALYSHTNSINLLSSRGYQMGDIEAWLEKQKETSINWMKSDNVKNPDKPYIDKAGMFYTTDGRMCYASDIEKQRDENAKNSFERGIRVGIIRQQKEQSITSNDLDEEIHRFFNDCIDVHEAKLYGNISERVIPVDCYEITARHFAKWGEKQKELSLEKTSP